MLQAQLDDAETSATLAHVERDCVLLLVDEGIDLKMSRGQVWRFLGPNGSGKMTTIRMICGPVATDIAIAVDGNASRA